MKNKKTPLTAVLLLISIGNYVKISSNENVRMVEFISILAIGVFAGVLATQLFNMWFTKK